MAEKKITVKEAQLLLETVSSLDEKTKELAFATLTGMRLVSEANRKNKRQTA
ncbi:hypothetical protein [Anaerosalibacter sp. Marseille-P3206]|uniref:hypothetical protein n=1 Tax=Anaerosalibacter sp. Marseille-P3206 TaxID=1871005 RepID=UPI0013565058|nr:hypothetical protein [Anaerosalibacter sp. Marseille-P3206]